MATSTEEGVLMKRERKEGKFVFFILGFMLLVTACGRQEKPTDFAGVFSSQIIIGDLDWKEITTLSTSNPIRSNGKAVGAVDLPVMGSRCTGFLISEDVFMTNHHCIPTSSHSRGVTVKFKHEKGVSAADHAKYDCSEFIGNNQELDFALLKCSGSPGRKFGFVKLDSDQKSQGSSIYIVQQNCDYYNDSNCDWTKKYSEGKITKVAAEYSHDADTLGGSSGSPMFSKTTHEVVGIHHAGAGNNGMGRGYENFAVPMSKIVPYILTNFPQVDLGGSGDDSDQDSGDQGQDYEPNNSLTNAAFVGLPFYADLSISSSTDNDYFKVKTNSSGKLKVKVSFVHSKGDLDVKLINGSKQTIAKSESTSSVEQIEFEVGEGTFYVKVFGYKGAKGSYKIEVTFEGQAAGNEPNDSIATATPVALPMVLKKEIESDGDKDFYEIKLASTKTVSASLSFSHSRGDLDLYILNTDGEVVDKSTGTKDLEAISRSLSKGTYYVVVVGYKSATGSYQLSLK
jgi:V8-like Glu-specific endopeptidase